MFTVAGVTPPMGGRRGAAATPVVIIVVVMEMIPGLGPELHTETVLVVTEVTPSTSAGAVVPRKLLQLIQRASAAPAVKRLPGQVL